MVLELNPPDWNSLVGGTVETSWIADRHRKLGIASTISEEIERAEPRLARLRTTIGNIARLAGEAGLHRVPPGRTVRPLLDGAPEEGAQGASVDASGQVFEHNLGPSLPDPVPLWLGPRCGPARCQRCRKRTANGSQRQRQHMRPSWRA